MFVHTLVILIESLQSNEMRKMEEEERIACLKQLIYNRLPFRWVRVIRKDILSDIYYKFTQPDGYCTYHMPKQIKANWDHFKEMEKPIPFEELKKSHYQLPQSVEECLNLLNKERETNISLLQAPSETLVEKFKNLINYLSMHLAESKHRLKFTGNQFNFWGYPSDQGILFLKDIPFMLFSSAIFEDDFNYPDAFDNCGKFVKKINNSRFIILTITYLLLDITSLFLWKDEQNNMQKDCFTMNDIREMFSKRHIRFAGCFAQNHYFLLPMYLKDFKEELLPSFDKFCDSLTRRLIEYAYRPESVCTVARPNDIEKDTVDFLPDIFQIYNRNHKLTYFGKQQLYKRLIDPSSNPVSTVSTVDETENVQGIPPEIKEDAPVDISVVKKKKASKAKTTSLQLIEKLLNSLQLENTMKEAVKSGIEKIVDTCIIDLTEDEGEDN